MEESRLWIDGWFCRTAELDTPKAPVARCSPALELALQSWGGLACEGAAGAVSPPRLLPFWGNVGLPSPWLQAGLWAVGGWSVEGPWLGKGTGGPLLRPMMLKRDFCNTEKSEQPPEADGVTPGWWWCLWAHAQGCGGMEAREGWPPQSRDLSSSRDRQTWHMCGLGGVW